MTAYPEQALRQILVDDTDVAALVSTRVYQGGIPQGGTLPSIAYILDGFDGEHSLDGHAGMGASEFSVRCVDEDYAGVKVLAEKVRLALDGYSGTVDVSGTGAGDDVVVRWTRHESSSDEDLRAADGSELPVKIVRIDITMHTETAIPS